MKNRSEKDRKRVWMYRRVFGVVRDVAILQEGFLRITGDCMRTGTKAPTREEFMEMVRARQERRKAG